MSLPNETKGVASLIAATLIYSFFGVLTRVIGFQIPIYYAGVVRDVIAAAILITLLLWNRQWKPIAKHDWIWFILRNLGGVVGFLGSYYSLYYLPFGTSYFIFYAGSTIGGYGLGALLLREHLTRLKIFSLILALIGLSFIYTPNIQTQTAFYMLLAIVGGFGTAIWNVFSKKIPDRYGAMQLNFMDFFMSFLIMGAISLILHETWVPITASGVWFANLLFLFLFIATGQLMVWGFRFLDAQIASVIMLSEVLFAIVVGYFLYHETLSILTVAGGVCIFSAIILPEIRWKKIITV